MSECGCMGVCVHTFVVDYACMQNTVVHYLGGRFPRFDPTAYIQDKLRKQQDSNLRLGSVNEELCVQSLLNLCLCAFGIVAPVLSTIYSFTSLQERKTCE